ncbi:MAG: carbohydrate porin [Chthoniobacter sp.]|nr:carbohydrate porin [Chthoniobacter sp.]
MKRLNDAGVTPLFNYTGEEFGNFAGGVGRGGNYEGLLKLGLTLDLEKLVKWTGGSLFFAVLYPHGLGVTNRYVHDYNVLSNIDAYDSWRVFEAWVQQDFADHRLSIRIGQLTTDNNFFVSDNSELYINSIFGEGGTALHNVITPIYPVASPGVLLKITPTPVWYFQAMVVSDDPGAQDGNNKHGLRYHFDGNTGALMFYELGYQRTGTDDAPVLEGKYKIGGFYDTGSFPDNRGGADHHGDYSFYAVADQQLYREALKPKEAFRGLAAFGRVSLAPENRNPVTCSFETGLNYNGLLPGRDKDILGVAFTYERLSSELRQPSGDPVASHHEHVLEATYLWTFNDHFSVQPDVQYIFNPGGIGTTPNAFVGGLRFTINF